jgi:putative hydrolase of the HAD superfamily
VIAVGFDFDHTLGLDHQLERTVALDLLERAAARAASAFDAETAARAATAAIGAFREGATGIDDALRSIGVDPGEFRRVALERAPEFVTAMPGARGLLATLRERGVATAILTNGWSPLQEAKARCIGFSGPVLVSDVLGSNKPARAAFLALAAALAADPAEVVFVGDDPALDVVGALEAGMRAAWLDWEGRTYPPHAPPPTWRVATLSELGSLLGQVALAANPAP